jgi:hypothetical protein
MTTNAVSQYPILVDRSAASIGEITKVGDLEFIQESVPATHMESGGWKEKIASGLKEVADFVCTINYTAAGLDTLMGDWSAGTVSSYTVTYANAEVGTFSALVTHIKVLGADADAPADKPLSAEITFEITGSASLT